jgi:hypothetical protein
VCASAVFDERALSPVMGPALQALGSTASLEEHGKLPGEAEFKSFPGSF